MSTIKRLRAPLIVMSGALLSVAAFAGPANAGTFAGPANAGTGHTRPCGCAYRSPIVAPQVLGTSVRNNWYTENYLSSSVRNNWYTENYLSSMTVTAVVPAAAAVVPAAAAVVPAAAAVAPAEVAGVSASAETSGLAFTGTNAIGIGALGGLLLVGGVTMVLVSKRRKVDA